ncbi:MAG: hypothetical protein Q27BB25_10475 [Blastomonas sp. CACIA14H2]|nr:MAG: hypothetical protein Q27BB25_10475 [Blastomonas sp. CACIA14H2]
MFQRAYLCTSLQINRCLMSRLSFRHRLFEMLVMIEIFAISGHDYHL